MYRGHRSGSHGVLHSVLHVWEKRMIEKAGIWVTMLVSGAMRGGQEDIASVHQQRKESKLDLIRRGGEGGLKEKERKKESRYDGRGKKNESKTLLTWHANIKCSLVPSIAQHTVSHILNLPITSPGLIFMITTFDSNFFFFQSDPVFLFQITAEITFTVATAIVAIGVMIVIQIFWCPLFLFRWRWVWLSGCLVTRWSRDTAASQKKILFLQPEIISLLWLWLTFFPEDSTACENYLQHRPTTPVFTHAPTRTESELNVCISDEQSKMEVVPPFLPL